MVNNELTHHGIKGQRWGVRRYQNKDGTLTKAGQRRYDSEMTKLKNEERVLKNKQRTAAKLDKLEAKRKSVDELRGKTTKQSEDAKSKKDIKSLSDSELRDKVARLELEKRYRDLAKQSEPPKSSAGKEFAARIIKSTGENILKQVANHYASKLANNLIGETMKVKDEETGEFKTVVKEVIYANNKKKS